MRIGEDNLQAAENQRSAISAKISSTIAEIPVFLAFVEALRFEKKSSTANNVNSYLICKLKDKQMESL